MNTINSYEILLPWQPYLLITWYCSFGVFYHKLHNLCISRLKRVYTKLFLYTYMIGVVFRNLDFMKELFLSMATLTLFYVRYNYLSSIKFKAFTEKLRIIFIIQFHSFIGTLAIYKMCFL